MFYYYSVCSLSISLHLFRSHYHNDTSCSVFCSFFLSFLFPSFSFCSFYAFFLLLFLFFLFFCSLFSSILNATPVLTIDLLLFFLFLPPLSLFFSFIFIYYLFIYFFVYLFNYLFIHYYYYYYYYFLSSLFRLYSITTSAHWLGVLSLILYTVSAV